MGRNISRLSLHSRLTATRLEEIRIFIDHGRSGMTAIWQSFCDDFDAITESWPQDRVDEYVYDIYDDIAMMRDQSPRLVRHAQCMIIYGTFENAIVGLCRAAHLDGKIADAPRERMNMRDAKDYLHPHLRQRPKPFADDWQWLDEFRIIRNWIAHNGGKAEKSGINLVTAKKFARRNAGLIKFGRLRDISVEDGLIDRACDKVNRAWSRIDKAVQAIP